MNSISIDSTLCRTTLCQMCAQAGTDKTPYAIQGHRHPYTAPYSLLFEPLKHKPIKFAEVGIFQGASLKVWSHFFTNAKIFGYDRDPNFLAYIQSQNYPNVFLGLMDAGDSQSIQEKFEQATNDGELFDVIIDDASHAVEHQCTMIRTALPFLKKGGLLIIEDINRDNPVKEFEEAFQTIKHLTSFHTFIRCDHALRYSPGWDNDKILLLVRN